ncbi:MAG: UDP-glucose/GDP-mannose dehydrogenase family protein [Burkholderiaceae bacterium]|nr:UDP-glucose/GDP-mannose dehydrogenase family protein [Burkholderiaceae bacterium]
MSIVIVGTGYVGLVTGACLSEVGHSVACVDVDAKRMKRLANGEVPFYEPGLEDLVRNGIDSKRLSFSTSLPDAYRAAKANRTLSAPVVMIAVGTPSSEDGSADVSGVLQVAREIGSVIDEYTVVASKSTVPVGTSEKIAHAVESGGADRSKFDVVSNPEFLKEGAAVDDFMRPSRIVLGSNAAAATELMLELYRPFNMSHERVMTMGTREAELTKYAANALLATKISFINEIANLCDKLGVDVDSVRRGIGSDPRIGHSFIYPGAGYGGSCFPKDVRALIHAAQGVGIDPYVLTAIHQRNEQQKHFLLDKVLAHFGNDLSAHTIAVWGLSFKPGTDDVREAPALSTVRGLLEAGANVRAFDPVASAQFEAALTPANSTSNRFTIVQDKYEALQGASAMLLLTEWKEFRNPDFERMRTLMKQPCVFDGRNQFDPNRLRAAGWTYVGVGRT